MTLLIFLAMGPAAGYLGYLIGVRRTRGLIEVETAAAEEEAYRRSERPGTVRMNTITIRR